MTDKDRIKYCQTCRDAKLSESCTDCPKATGPELIPENEDALDVMMAVRTQWRGAGFGVIGLDYVTVYAEAERIGVDLSPCCMAKIRALEYFELNRMNKRDE